MLVACIVTYNDYPLIKDCVNSIIDKVDKIVAVDGRYIDFPGDYPYSTDGTLEYLDSLDKVDLILVSGADEVQKRNIYLTKCSDEDIVLNLDSDEVLKGSIPELTCDFGIIDLHDGHSKHIQKRATRFFKYRKGMQYRNVHYTLYWQDKIINNLHEVINKDFSFEPVKDFHLIHNWHLREGIRKYYKSQYYKILVRNESGFIK